MKPSESADVCDVILRGIPRPLLEAFDKAWRGSGEWKTRVEIVRSWMREYCKQRGIRIENKGRAKVQ